MNQTIPPRITRVFVDMDGVMNRFSSYALMYVNALDYMLPYGDYPKGCQTWDIVKSANLLKDPQAPKYSSSKFWDSLDREFWATIPPEPHLTEMMEYLVDQVGIRNVCIASTPTLCPESLAGKLIWVKKHLPTFMHRQYMFGVDKSLLAKPDRLLIDDNQDNCVEFGREGGHYLLVPRPWNVLRGYNKVRDDSAWDHTFATLQNIFGDNHEYQS